MSEIYPGGDAQYSPNLGLALWGTDEVTTENFLLIDAAVGAGSSVRINGTVIPNVNFVNSASVTFAVSGSNVSLTASGSGSTAWSSLTNAIAPLVLNNAGFATTFDQTSPVQWTWANTTASTVSASQNSPILALQGMAQVASFTPIAADNFQRPNETPLSDGGSWSGVTGAVPFILPNLVSHLVEVAAVSTPTAALWTGSGVFPNDQYSEVTIAALSASRLDSVGLAVRTALATYTGYYLQMSGPLGPNATMYIAKVVAGVGTVLTETIFVNLEVGSLVRLTVIGSTIIAKLNGVVVLTAVDSSIASGYPGFTLYSANISTTQVSAWYGGTLTSVNTTDGWTIQDVISGTSIDSSSTLTFLHNGTPVQGTVSIPTLSLGGNTISLSSIAAGVLAVGDGTPGSINATVETTNITLFGTLEWPNANASSNMLISPIFNIDKNGVPLVGPITQGSAGDRGGGFPVMAIEPVVAGNRGLVIQYFASQTADLFDIQNSAGMILHTFAANGFVGIGINNNTTSPSAPAALLSVGPASQFQVDATGAVRTVSTVTSAGLLNSGIYQDSTSSVGTSGQVLSSTVTGTKWATPSGGAAAWATLTGDMTETQVAPWDGPTVGTKDTGISRTAPATLAIGNGTTGDSSGFLKLVSVGSGTTTSLLSFDSTETDGFYIVDDDGDNTIQGGDSTGLVLTNANGPTTLSLSDLSGDPIFTLTDSTCTVASDVGGNLNFNSGLSGQIILNSSTVAEVDLSVTSQLLLPTPCTLSDGAGNIGTAGQLLSSAGLSGVLWVNAATLKTTSLLTAQTASVSNHALVTSSATKGMWRVSYVATQTTAGSAGTVLGGTTGFRITFVNANGDTVTKTTAITSPTVGVGTSTADTISGDQYCYAGATTAITYSFGYTPGGVTGGAFDLAVYAEFLG